jgi:flagellar biosynthetic protein FliR
MTISYLPDLAWTFFILFARTGSLIMLMPALGEQVIPARIRLSFALLLTFVMIPLVSNSLPPMPSGIPMMVFLLFRELLIGLFIGASVRVLISAMQTAGNVIAFQMGLGFAMSVDPSQGIQSVLIGNFLGLLGTALIFATDLHHLAIAGYVGSYTLFPPGEWISLGDSVSFGVSMVALSFEVAIKISAPFLVFGIIFNLALGVLSRLMPQLQVFLIALPASISVGFILLAVLIAAMMGLYLEHLEEVLSHFLA